MQKQLSFILKIYIIQAKFLFYQVNQLRRNCTHDQNWDCFVSYLKIINTFWFENNIMILKKIVKETQKWH